MCVFTVLHALGMTVNADGEKWSDEFFFRIMHAFHFENHLIQCFVLSVAINANEIK